MKRLTVLIACLLCAACAAPTAHKDMSAFQAASPRSILVVPVVNKSLDVDAPNYVLTTMSIPIAEKGYYVFPVNTVKTVLEQEGFYEPERIQQESPASLCKFFGADAVLFVTINRWDAQYAVLATVVTVNLSYRMFDRSGVEIWSAQKQISYSPQNQSSGNAIADLIAMAVSAALTKAAPNYMPLARQANQMVFVTEGTALPDGPHRKPR